MPIQPSMTMINAIIMIVTLRLSSVPATTTWISSTGMGVRIWQIVLMIVSIQPPK